MDHFFRGPVKWAPWNFDNILHAVFDLNAAGSLHARYFSRFQYRFDGSRVRIK